jgi:O-acetyl-ADP-ribose deacetylase (regulator of RNase III)
MTEATDIFLARADALVNPVNCVGAMGKGLALEFRKRFPEYYLSYRQACLERLVSVGCVWWWENHRWYTHQEPRWIASFPTKDHWRDKSNLQYIEAGMRDLIEGALDMGVRSIAIPALGCGLGGLNWSDVKPLIDRFVEALPSVKCMVFPPREETCGSSTR